MKLLGILTALACTALISPRAFCGGNSGGGGVFIELDVLAVSTFLNENCYRFESFKKHQVDCLLFRKKIKEVGMPGGGLSINEGQLHLRNGKAVDAINKLPAKIKIAQPGWMAAGGDITLKVGLTAHEFLSLMGLEYTGYYTISGDLVNELRTSGHFPAFTATQPNSLAWLRSQMRGPKAFTTRDLGGIDPVTGRPCGLFLTNRSYGETEDYYIVVGYTDSRKSPEDYIGVIASETTGSMSDAEVKLHSDQPWGNMTAFNAVKIKVSLFGRPLSASGKSDRKTIQCKLNGTDHRN